MNLLRRISLRVASPSIRFGSINVPDRFPDGFIPIRFDKSDNLSVDTVTIFRFPLRRPRTITSQST